ncbi:hypothetical protein C0J52_17608 [Blattella germanica]|nr:hypothetical protein C0J52_17608 [Blattella germanica]
MLHELSKQALKLTLKRITKSADLKKRITMNPVSAINFGEVVPKLTKALLTSNITNFSECEEVQQAVDAMFESFSRTSHTCSHMSFSKYLQ